MADPPGPLVALERPARRRRPRGRAPRRPRGIPALPDPPRRLALRHGARRRAARGSSSGSRTTWSRPPARPSVTRAGPTPTRPTPTPLRGSSPTSSPAPTPRRSSTTSSPFQRRVARVGVVHSLVADPAQARLAGRPPTSTRAASSGTSASSTPTTAGPSTTSAGGRLLDRIQRRPRRRPPRGRAGPRAVRRARGRRDQALRRLDGPEPPPGPPRPLPPRVRTAVEAVGDLKGRMSRFARQHQARRSWPSPPDWSPA